MKILLAILPLASLAACDKSIPATTQYRNVELVSYAPPPNFTAVLYEVDSGFTAEIPVAKNCPHFRERVASNRRFRTPVKAWRHSDGRFESGYDRAALQQRFCD